MAEIGSQTSRLPPDLLERASRGCYSCQRRMPSPAATSPVGVAALKPAPEPNTIYLRSSSPVISAAAVFASQPFSIIDTRQLLQILIAFQSVPGAIDGVRRFLLAIAVGGRANDANAARDFCRRMPTSIIPAPSRAIGRYRSSIRSGKAKGGIDTSRAGVARFAIVSQHRGENPRSRLDYGNSGARDR